MSIEDAKLYEIDMRGIKRATSEAWRVLLNDRRYMWGSRPDTLQLYTDGKQWWEAIHNWGADASYPNPHFDQFEDFESIHRIKGDSGTITVKEMRDLLKGRKASDVIHVEAELDGWYDDYHIEWIDFSAGPLRTGSHFNDEQVAAIEEIIKIREERDSK